MAKAYCCLSSDLAGLTTIESVAEVDGLDPLVNSPKHIAQGPIPGLQICLEPLDWDGGAGGPEVAILVKALSFNEQ